MKRNNPNGSEALHCALHDTEYDASEHCYECLKGVAEAVIAWAAAPVDHGGNPYCKPFVRLARKAMRDD